MIRAAKGPKGRERTTYTSANKSQARTVDAMTALSLMKEGKVVQRVGQDGTTGKFTRIFNGDVQTAVGIKALVEGRWERASTDITTFVLSKYRVVSKIHAKVTVLNGSPLMMDLAIARMQRGEVMRRIAPGNVQEQFFKMVNGEMVSAKTEEDYYTNNWIRATIDVASFFGSKFATVVRATADEATVEFEYEQGGPIPF